MLRRHRGPDRLDEDLDQLDAIGFDDSTTVVVEDEREFDVPRGGAASTRTVRLGVDQADLGRPETRCGTLRSLGGGGLQRSRRKPAAVAGPQRKQRASSDSDVVPAPQDRRRRDRTSRAAGRRFSARHEGRGSTGARRSALEGRMCCETGRGAEKSCCAASGRTTRGGYFAPARGLVARRHEANLHRSSDLQLRFTPTFAMLHEVGRAAAAGGARRGGSAVGAPTPSHARRVWIARASSTWPGDRLTSGIKVMDRTVPPLIGPQCASSAAGLVMYAFLGASPGRCRVCAPASSPRSRWSACCCSAAKRACHASASCTFRRGFAALLVASMPLWLVVLRTITATAPRPDAGRPRPSAPSAWRCLCVGGAQRRGREHPARRVAVARRVLATGSLLRPAAAGQMTWRPGTAIEDDDRRAGARGDRGHWRRALVDGVRPRLPGLGCWRFVLPRLAGSSSRSPRYVWLLRNAPISQITYAYVNPGGGVRWCSPP